MKGGSEKFVLSSIKGVRSRCQRGFIAVTTDSNGNGASHKLFRATFWANRLDDNSKEHMQVQAPAASYAPFAIKTRHLSLQLQQTIILIIDFACRFG